MVGVVWFNAAERDCLYWDGGDDTSSSSPVTAPTQRQQLRQRPSTAPEKGANLEEMGFREVKLPRPMRPQQQMSQTPRGKVLSRDDPNFKQKLRNNVLKRFEDELDMPTNLDFGSKAVSRAQLRCLVQEVVLEGAKIAKRNYSSSHLSSNRSSRVGEEAGDDPIARLKALQKERLIVVRMGFVERANQLDAEIAEWRAKAARAKADGEAALLDQNLRELESKIMLRRERLVKELDVETQELDDVLLGEFNKMRLGQRQEFLRIVENCERRAMGKVKKCNCGSPFLCKHNKTASYNIRKPIKEVLNFRQNSKRLRKGGRMEDSQMWEEKANDIDFKEAETFRLRVAKSIISSPWGANEAAIDKLIQKHKKESDLVKKTQAIRRDVLKEKQQRRVFAFDNLAVAERQRVRLASKKEFARRCLELGEQAYQQGSLADGDEMDDEGESQVGGLGLAFDFDQDDLPPGRTTLSFAQVQADAHMLAGQVPSFKAVGVKREGDGGRAVDGGDTADHVLYCEPCEPDGPPGSRGASVASSDLIRLGLPLTRTEPRRGADGSAAKASFSSYDDAAYGADEDMGLDFGLDADAPDADPDFGLGLGDDDDEALEAAAAEAEEFLRKNAGGSGSFSSQKGGSFGSGGGGRPAPSPPKVGAPSAGPPSRGGVRYVA